MRVPAAIMALLPMSRCGAARLRFRRTVAAVAGTPAPPPLPASASASASAACSARASPVSAAGSARHGSGRHGSGRHGSGRHGSGRHGSGGHRPPLPRRRRARPPPLPRPPSSGRRAPARPASPRWAPPAGSSRSRSPGRRRSPWRARWSPREGSVRPTGLPRPPARARRRWRPPPGAAQGPRVAGAAPGMPAASARAPAGRAVPASAIAASPDGEASPASEASCGGRDGPRGRCFLRRRGGCVHRRRPPPVPRPVPRARRDRHPPDVVRVRHGVERDRGGRRPRRTPRTRPTTSSSTRPTADDRDAAVLPVAAHPHGDVAATGRDCRRFGVSRVASTSTSPLAMARTGTRAAVRAFGSERSRAPRSSTASWPERGRRASDDRTSTCRSFCTVTGSCPSARGGSCRARDDRTARVERRRPGRTACGRRAEAVGLWSRQARPASESASVRSAAHGVRVDERGAKRASPRAAAATRGDDLASRELARVRSAGAVRAIAGRRLLPGSAAGSARRTAAGSPRRPGRGSSGPRASPAGSDHDVRGGRHRRDGRGTRRGRGEVGDEPLLGEGVAAAAGAVERRGHHVVGDEPADRAVGDRELLRDSGVDVGRAGRGLRGAGEHEVGEARTARRGPRWPGRRGRRPATRDR